MRDPGSLGDLDALADGGDALRGHREPPGAVVILVDADLHAGSDPHVLVEDRVADDRAAAERAAATSGSCTARVTPGESTDSRADAPETITPFDTMLSIAFPTRSPSSWTNLAGGLLGMWVRIGHSRL